MVEPSAANDEQGHLPDADDLERLAQSYYRQGQVLAALRTYDEIIRMGAATTGTWRAAGNALADVGEFAQAIGAYENCLRLDAADAAAHHNLARVLYRLGEVDTAARHLRTAAGLSSSIDPWLGLATIIPACPTATHASILQTRGDFAKRLAEWSRTVATAAGANRRVPRASGFGSGTSLPTSTRPIT